MLLVDGKKTIAQPRRTKQWLPVTLDFYADSVGISHFEDVTTLLTPGFAAPPAEPLDVAAFLPTGDSSWLGVTSDWKGDEMHPVPKRLLFVVSKGAAEITAGDGETRTFVPGDVFLAEDTTGSGHSTRITGAIGCMCLIFALP
jgi:hypothetical protein